MPAGLAPDRCACSASASIGGRFGAPEYTGELNGTSLGVRNVLQGVDVSDGDVAIVLLGDTRTHRALHRPAPAAAAWS